MKTFLWKLRALLTGRKGLEDDLRDEMSAHLEFEIEERIRQGMSTEEARRAARCDFGSTSLIADETRDAWGWTWFDQLRQDLIYTVRSLRRSIGFTISAVGVLALGIGVNVAVIHILNAAVFHRLSVRDAESIIAFERSGRFPYPMIEFFREHSSAFSYIIAERSGSSVFFEDDPQPEVASFISSNYFSDLGVIPSQGRLFDERDAQRGATQVVVLSHRHWERRFGSDPGVVGRILKLNGKPVHVAGIAPANFTGLSSRPASQQPMFWLPITLHPILYPGSQALSSFSQRDTEMYAVLKPGVSLEAANAQIISLAGQLQKMHPDRIQMRPEAAGTGRPLLHLPIDALIPMALAMSLFLLVLLTACANLGNLLLARGHTRAREIGIRIAVGAGRSRIVRQLMVENLVLAVLGSAAGLVVGYAVAKTLLPLAGAPPDLLVVTDWRIVMAGALLAVCSAIGFGLVPARQAVRTSSAKSMRRGTTRSRRVLIGVQVAASCFLLILGGQLARSIQRRFAPDVRFDYRNLIVIDPQLHTQNVSALAARQILDEIQAQLRLVAGVTDVTTTLSAPFSGRGLMDSRLGFPISYNRVESSYFSVMDLPLVRGRLFDSNEQDVIVLSESSAQRIWNGEDPLGEVLEIPNFSSDSIETGRSHVTGTERRTVIGIVKDTGSTVSTIVEAYVPLKDGDLPKTLLMARVQGNVAEAARVARKAASLPGIMPSSWLVETALEQDTARQRLVAQIVASLGATATLLAVLGIFGVIAFAVSQRTQELGVRIALGARPLNLLSALLAEYAVAMTTGAVAGMALAAAAGRALQNQIFGLLALDPVAYVVALAAFATAALVAVLIPARHALRIDPAAALRWE